MIETLGKSKVTQKLAQIKYTEYVHVIDVTRM